MIVESHDVRCAKHRPTGRVDDKWSMCCESRGDDQRETGLHDERSYAGQASGLDDLWQRWSDLSTAVKAEARVMGGPVWQRQQLCSRCTGRSRTARMLGDWRRRAEFEVAARRAGQLRGRRGGRRALVEPGSHSPRRRPPPHVPHPVSTLTCTLFVSFGFAGAIRGGGKNSWPRRAPAVAGASGQLAAGRPPSTRESPVDPVAAIECPTPSPYPSL